jgi:hypothetical protein
MFQILDANLDISVGKRPENIGEERKLLSVGNTDKEFLFITENGDIKSAQNVINASVGEGASFYFDRTTPYYLSVSDSSNFSFNKTSADSPFTFIIGFNQATLSNLSNDEKEQFKKILLSKYNTGAFEWIAYTNKFSLFNYDNASNNISISITEDLEYEKNYIVAYTYDGSRTVAGFNAYVNGNNCLVSKTTSGAYTGQTNTITEVRFGTTVSSTTDSFKGKIFFVRVFNRELTKEEVQKYTFGMLDYTDISANNTNFSSGTLVEGKRYRIENYVPGDDFLHVGASSNATGVEFIATGSTPKSWINTTEVRQIGCVAEYVPEKISLTSWDEIQNNTSAIPYGAISLNVVNGSSGYHDGFLYYKNDNTLSFVNGTRVFTITAIGSGYTFYSNNNRYVRQTDSITIADTEGGHYIYYKPDGVLDESVNPTTSDIVNIIKNYAFVSYIYWDATNKVASIGPLSEQHGVHMNSDTHMYLHSNLKTRWVSGLGLSSIITDASGNLASHAQWATDSGQIQDEDLIHTINAVSSTAGYRVYYNSGLNAYLRVGTNPTFGVLTTGTGRLAYNNINQGGVGVWGLTEVGNNDYVLYHVFATNDVNYPIISVMGQSTYPTVSSARVGATVELNNLLVSFPSPEFKALGTIIFQTSDSYGNAVKARIRTTDTGGTYLDWRKDQIGTSLTPSDHNSLTGLQFAQAGNTYGHINDTTQTIAGDKTFSSGVKILSGRTIVGGTVDPKAGGTGFSVLAEADDPLSLIRASDTDALGVSLIAFRSRGTVASPTAVQSGDVLAGFYGGGYYTTGTPDYTNASSAIRMITEEAFTSTAWGTKIVFATTAVGSATRIDRWVISSEGALYPYADATYDIGTSTVGINDLHFGLGGIINFDGGDLTLTHSANLLTLAGGDLALGTNNLTLTGNIASSGSPVAVGYFTDAYIGGMLLQDSANRSGLLEINRLGTTTYTGVQIKFSATGLWSFMGHETVCGLYDDANSDWILLYNENEAVSLYYNGTHVFNTTSTGIDLVSATPLLNIGTTAVSTGDCILQIGNGRSGNGNSHIDLVGDVTYTDYGTRLIRGSGGANTNTTLYHRGTGSLVFDCIEAGAIVFQTTNTSRWAISSAGTLYPVTNATYDIGTTSLGVNDIHIGSGGVINFANGDVTLTHATDNLTLDGAVSLNYKVLATSGSLYLDNYSATYSHQHIIHFRKSAQDTVGNTLTVGGEALGDLRWYGNTGSGFALAARFYCEQGTAAVGTNAPGSLKFNTSPGGASGTITRLTIGETGICTFSGNIAFGTDATYDIGTSTVGINDLHFGSGGIINFDGGDLTLTHSANKLTLAGGVLSITDQSYVFATHTSSQSIANNTTTTIIFNNEVTDTLGEYNPSTGVFTATHAGNYTIDAALLFVNTAWPAGAPYALGIVPSAGTALYARRQSTAITEHMGIEVSATVKLAAGETVIIHTIQVSGSSKNTYAGSNWTYLTIQKVS